MATSIQLYSQPAFNVFSRNPIPFGFRITPFTLANSTRQKVTIVLEFANTMENPTFQNVWTGSVSPDANGLAHIDLATILDPLLHFYIPNLNLAKLHMAKNQCGQFRFKYYVEQDNTIVSHQEQSRIFNVYKGGVAKEYHDKESTYLNTELIINKKPLHFYDSDEKVRHNEVKWMYFIYDGNSANLNIEFNMSANNEDAFDPYEFYPFLSQNLRMVKGQVYCTRIDLLFTEFPIYSNIGNVFLAVDYEVQIFTSPGSGVLIYPNQIMKVDSRPFLEEMFIQYRNSLGGLETQAILGELEIGSTIQAEVTEVVPLNSAIGNFYLDTIDTIDYSTHRPAVKANTGWITEAQLKRLVDMLMTKEVYQLKTKRIVPITINTRSLTLYKSKDKLFNLAFEFASTHEDENFSIENIVAYTGTCPAVEFIQFEQIISGYITVTWKLPYTLDQLEVTYTGTVPGGALPPIAGTLILNGNSGTRNIFILNPIQSPIVNYIIQIKGRVVCDNETIPGSFGPYSPTETHVIYSMIDPIAVDDVADLSARNNLTRILKKNAVEMNLLENDLPKTLPEVEFHNFTTALGTTASTSANGANLVYLGSGRLSYTPTPASLANLNEDIVYYKCREAIGLGGLPYTYSNIAQIRVPLTGQIHKVYVKMTLLNVNESIISLPFPNFFIFGPEIVADVYLQFFKDSALTIPVDVTTYGLVIGYALGRLSTPMLTATPPTFLPNFQLGTIACTGFNMIAFANFKLNTVDTISALKLQFSFAVNNATSVGNFEIVGTTF